MLKNKPSIFSCPTRPRIIFFGNNSETFFPISRVAKSAAKVRLVALPVQVRTPKRETRQVQGDNGLPGLLRAPR